LFVKDSTGTAQVGFKRNASIATLMRRVFEK
jgi:hypothetical protein